ncbi:SCO2522 family protein [Natronoglycomyces albus]|uniref:Uncharacterized protein n=1 Tax=Natronoglycomyces albus TaxID=2811108 RepID=A0A895XQL4_9ACTN|nr:SCO2522 family protein [Natronoglycomyces albus]QSB06002.1 hypothetical protein JQS30_03500 [Natronoglycomyces albus]
METDVEYTEHDGDLEVERLGMSHLSVELGHLYADDFTGSADRLFEQMCAAAGWYEAAKAELSRKLGSRRMRVSTCYLIDDYQARQIPRPVEAIALLLKAAHEAGVTIDYIGRESACALIETRNEFAADSTHEIEIARLVAGQIVQEPPQGATGFRPRVEESGWLCNGRRSPGQNLEAMGEPSRWEAPEQYARSRLGHTIFLDTQLWEDKPDDRIWTCPMLAAVWQLLRLGLLRNHGRSVAQPEFIDFPAAISGPDKNLPLHVKAERAAKLTSDDEDMWLPDEWHKMPAVLQVNPEARPFTAYRTMSIMSGAFLETEHAVRTICSMVQVSEEVRQVVQESADREGVFCLPPEVPDRISYVFQGHW